LLHAPRCGSPGLRAVAQLVRPDAVGQQSDDELQFPAARRPECVGVVRHAFGARDLQLGNWPALSVMGSRYGRDIHPHGWRAG